MSQASETTPGVARAAFPLYDDVVRLVINNLTVPELHFAVQLSKQWHRLVQSMKPPLRLATNSRQLHRIVSGSAVASHIAEAPCLDLSLEAVPDLLLGLFEVLPNLRVLSTQRPMTLDIFPLSSKQHFQLPNLLETIDVNVHFEALTSFLVAVSNLQHLRSLRLFVSGGGQITFGQLDFSPLLEKENALSTMTSCVLHLNVWHADRNVNEQARTSLIPLSPSLVTFLRRAGQLTELDVSHRMKTIPHFVKQLTDEGPECPLIQNGNLKSLNVDRFTLKRPLLEALAKLPSLTSLEPWMTELQPPDMQLLSKLPNLVNLRLFGEFDVEYGKEPYTVEAVITAAKNAPQLKTFHFRQDNLTSENLDQILAHLPHVTDLAVSDCPKLSSLRPLIKYCLPDRLTNLSVTFCNSVPVEDVEKYVFPLQNLTSLRLSGFFHDGVTPELREQLSVGTPASRLPRLEQCFLPYKTKVANLMS